MPYSYLVTALCQLLLCHCAVSCSYSSYHYNYSSTTGNKENVLHRKSNSHYPVSRSSQVDKSICPPWYNVNVSTNAQKCICRKEELWHVLKCDDDLGGLLQVGYCMTRNSRTGIYSIGYCPYYQSNRHVTKDGYTRLPDNISELNDYLCRSMNRTGPMCHRCIPGFGPSVTSVNFPCSKCTNIWLGSLLYLLVELIPITLLYILILVFRINITSAPMTCLIMYSQGVVSEYSYNRNSKEIHSLLSFLSQLNDSQITAHILPVAYSSMNFEFFHCIIPAFCISSKLRTIHIILLGYVSAVYPLCLVILTWLCVELHDRNCRPLVILWKPFHRYWVRLRTGLNAKNDLIDVFASFFLLSYSKTLYQSMLLVGCCTTVNFDESQPGDLTYKYAKCFDPSESCISRENLKITIPAAIVMFVFNILPALLLVLYPFRMFRACLSKCKLDGMGVTMFVDIFHSCYRDGLNGGRDMRSFSGLYFFLRFYSLLCILITSKDRFVSIWICNALAFFSVAVLIGYTKPYRKQYMNILDTLVLINAALANALLSQKPTKLHLSITIGLIFLPMAVFMLVILVAAIIKILRISQKLAVKCCRCCIHWIKSVKEEAHNQHLTSPNSVSTIATKYGALT